MKHWMAAVGVGLILLIGVAVLFGVWADGDWGPNRGELVSRSISADGTETIVVREGHRGFFPIGIVLFPLFIFGSVMFFRAIAFRGAWGRSGPWMPGGPPVSGAPGWFDEWHRRAHAADAPPPSPEDDQPA